MTLRSITPSLALTALLPALLAAPALGASLDFAPQYSPPPTAPASADRYDFSTVDAHLFAVTAFEFYYRHDRALDGHRRVALPRTATLGPAWVVLGGGFLDHIRASEGPQRVAANVSRRLESRAITTLCAGAAGETGDFRDAGRVLLADAGVDPSLPSALGRFELHWQAQCTTGPRSDTTSRLFGVTSRADYSCAVDWTAHDTYDFDPANPQAAVGVGAPFTASGTWSASEAGSAFTFGCGAPNLLPTAVPDAPPTAVPDSVEVAIRTANGHYLVAPNGGGGGLDANRGAVGPWETFTWIDHRDGTVSLRSNAGRFVVAEGAGGGTANADRYTIGAWERFTPEFFADGSFALRTANGHYLVAEGAGGGAVNANRTAVGSWERFTRVPVTAPRIALRHAFGDYWTADQGGGYGMDSAGEAVNAWERFTLVSLGGGLVHIQAGSGQYVVAESGGGGAVNANRWDPQSWETFTIEPLADGGVNIGTANGGALRSDHLGGLSGGFGRGFSSQRIFIETLSGISPR